MEEEVRNILRQVMGEGAPATQVEAWLSAQDGAMVYFTAVGEAKLRHGVALVRFRAMRELNHFNNQQFIDDGALQAPIASAIFPQAF